MSDDPQKVELDYEMLLRALQSQVGLVEERRAALLATIEGLERMQLAGLFSGEAA